MQANKIEPSFRRELNALAVKHGFRLEEISGYALVNQSGHVRLYPDLANVSNALESMELEIRYRQEGIKQ